MEVWEEGGRVDVVVGAEWCGVVWEGLGYRFSGLARQTEVMMFLRTGSQSSGILRRVFSFATAKTICTPCSPFHGVFRATISCKKQKGI
mgnify:CR=1 FL=1